MPKIAIVNEKDEIIGACSKVEARAQGLIHRIVRLLIFNDDGKLLLQRRGAELKDSPNKWDFSVSGHVDEGETYEKAAQRETTEELGLSSLTLTALTKFYNEKPREDGYARRFNTVFTCITSQEPQIDRREVAEVRWVTLDEIAVELQKTPQHFTTTFASKFFEIVELLKERESHLPS